MNWQQMLAAAPGLTYRQLDHWSRKGYLRAENPDDGTGRSRTFPRSEAAIAAVMSRLVRAGLAPESACRVARGESIGEGIRVWVVDHAPTPVGCRADLLATGNAHSLTLRGGRLILDGHDVTDEHPVGVAS